MELFARLMRAAESLDDVALFDAVKAVDDGFRVPGTVAHAILDGTHPVKAWRDYRGLTQDALAEKASLSKGYLSQIETGKRVGVAKTLKTLAAALGVTLSEIS